MAGAVRTLDDIRAFVKCAHEYAMENGTAETRRAFNEDARWKSLPIYVFVDELKPTAKNPRCSFIRRTGRGKDSSGVR